MESKKNLKSDVKEYWEQSSCGEVYANGKDEEEFYKSQRIARYKLEPYIPAFANFEEGKGKDILEIGVGMGADHVEWAKSQPNSLYGIDLSPKAIKHTYSRLKLHDLKSELQIADAENLPFENNSFDIVYSWGVLHHSPNTTKAINEIYRVLRPSGKTRIMIYYKYSLTGYMLWLRYGLFSGKPYMSLNKIYDRYLESPGTKAYSIENAKELLRDFSNTNFNIQLNVSDLLEGKAGKRHAGLLLKISKKIWPRWLFKRYFKNCGLYLLIEATK